MTVQITKAADRICGLIEKMCSISYSNELYDIKGHNVINQKRNIHLNMLNLEKTRFAERLVVIRGHRYLNLSLSFI